MKFVLATCRAKPNLTASDSLLAEALGRLGAAVEAAPWDGIDPRRADAAVILRSTWDYHLRWDEFREWVRAFDGRGGLWNPADTVLWNADKGYLRELEAAGVALPRTRWFSRGERPDVDAVLDDWGRDRAVLKPRVSATAYGTHVVSRGQRLSSEEWVVLEQAGCLLQAFVPEIQTQGEISLVFLDGRFSHAMLKRPGTGDFRVQTDFGGSLGPAAAEESTVAFGAAVLAAANRRWLYARVDLVETESGPLLMELELIEPDLFLTPPAAEKLAEGLVRGGMSDRPAH